MKRKRILALFLAAVSCLSLAVSASAANTPNRKATDFRDFDKSAWYAEAVSAAVDNGLLYGKSSTIIDPNGDMTRAEMAAIINRSFGCYKAADISQYKDVAKSKWYYKDVALAVQMGTYNGRSSSAMAPDSPISRQEAMTVVARALELDYDSYSKTDLSTFSDRSEISNWALPYVRAMVGADCYYEAMLNILREENGCDLTYFIEYYLELLSRAVEERRLRQRQKEERARQEEMALARTPLMAAAVPASDPTPPDSGRPAPPGPETAEASEVPTETDPNYPERGGENKDWLSADSWAGNDTEMDSETSIARVRGKFCHLASNSGPVMKTGAKFLLSLMDNQVDTFTVDDIVNGCGFTLKQAGNFVTHLREMSLIESVGKRTNRCMIYQFATAQLPLGPQDYSPEIIQAIAELRSSARSAKDRRIGEILAASLSKGMITAADYTDAEDAAKIYTDMLLPEQMGIVKKVAPGVYRINRNIIETVPTPSGSQKTALSALYQSFGSEPFTREGAMAAMKLGKSSTCSLLHQLSLLRLIDCQENDVFVYRLRVNPNDHPTLFAGDPTPPVSPPEDNHSAPEPVSALAEGYSQDVLEQLNILSESSTSNRDRRVSEVLRSCLAKGTLLRSDYEARGYSDNMWLADTALAAQLGLITKQPDGDYTINRELQTEFSKLKPHQRKAITAIYEAFGYDTFSSEMFVATLNYSVSYTYASLHKLTLLRILEQKITDEGCQYQLLVNPEDHPECFIEAA